MNKREYSHFQEWTFFMWLAAFPVLYFEDVHPQYAGFLLFWSFIYTLLMFYIAGRKSEKPKSESWSSLD